MAALVFERSGGIKTLVGAFADSREARSWMHNFIADMGLIVGGFINYREGNKVIERYRIITRHNITPLFRFHIEEYIGE